MQKIEEMNSELNKSKVDNRKKIYMVEEDLNQTKNCMIHLAYSLHLNTTKQAS